MWGICPASAGWTSCRACSKRRPPEGAWGAAPASEGMEFAEAPFVSNLGARLREEHTLRYPAVRRPLRGALRIGANDCPAVAGRWSCPVFVDS